MKKNTLSMVILFLLSTVLFPATGWYNDYVKINVNGAGTSAPTGWYWIGSNPGYATQLDGTNLGTVTSLVIDGCDMKYWSDNQDRTGGAFYYKIMSADGLTEIVGAVETIWSQTYLGGNDYQGLATTTINLLATLKPGTTYKLHVWAKSWGSSQGDSWLSNSGSNYVATFTTSNVMIFGSNTITDGSGYSTLKGAFDALNGVTDQSGKNIEVKIGANTTETATASLSQPTNPWTSLTIYPTNTGISISGSLTGSALISFNGADKVTIDGRVNRSGTRSLSLFNSASGAASNFVVTFANDATLDTVMYCIIKGQNTGTTTTTYGLLTFGTATAGGNDNIVIDNCDFDGMGNSTLLINSNGSGAPNQNSGIIISNNLFHDFYLGATSTQSTWALRFGAGNDQITVTGNSFYQTSTRSYTTASAVSHQIIEFNSTTGNGHVITKNYFGGSSAFCGGTPYTVASGQYRLMGVIVLTIGSASVTRVDSNVIRNFDITSSFTTAGSSIFIANYVTNGLVSFTRDTVGSAVGTGSIKVTATANTGALFVGFNFTSTGANITANFCVVGSLQGVATGTSLLHVYPFAVDRSAAATTITIKNSLIGSLTTANSIQTSAVSTSTNNIHAIRLAPTGSQNLNAVVDSNIICNIGFVTGTSGSQLIGIIGTNTSSSSYNANYTITNNQIYNLFNPGANTGTLTTSSVQGIIVNAGNSVSHTVSGNTIYNLANTASTSSATSVFGIYISGTSTTVSRNKIYDLSTASTATSGSNILGIYTALGTININNNMISLGNSLSNSPTIVGVDKSGGTVTAYFNTIRLLGSPTANAVNTFAMRRTSSNNENFRNNILINERSNSGSSTGKHFAISLNSNSLITIDYNNYYANGIGGILGFLTSDKTTLLDWQNATTQDANSKSAAVTFVSETDLHLSGTSIGDFSNLIGTPISGIANDIDGDERNALYPYKGADENPVPLPVTLSKISARLIDRNVIINWTSSTEINLNKYIIERKQLIVDKSISSEWVTVGERSGSGNSNSLKSYSFTDSKLNTGKYSYRLKVIDNDGSIDYSPEVRIEVGKPSVYDLKQNYPNTFNPSTKIEYQLANISDVKIDLYNITGQFIQTLVNESANAGYYVYLFDANKINNGLSSGIYLYRMTAIDKITGEKFISTKKMNFIK